MTSPSPRPTREEVDAALLWADDYNGVGWGKAGDLADEVRALRAEQAQEVDVAARAINDLRHERDELRAALAARTPQPVEPEVTRPVGALRHAGGNVDRWNGRGWVPTVIVAGSTRQGPWTEDAAPQPAVPDGPETPATVDVRMERPTAPDWGGEYTKEGRQLYHHAWDSTDGNVRLWVGPYTAERSEPSWAVTVQADGVDVVMRCTAAEVVEWADEVKAAVDASAVLVASEPDVPDVRVVCGDVSGPAGIGGECVLPPGHPHVDGIGGQWPAVPDGEDAPDLLGALQRSIDDARRKRTTGDGEDVPSRLEAAADALRAVGMPYCAQQLANVADTIQDVTAARAAVAAALARPTGHQQ